MQPPAQGRAPARPPFVVKSLVRAWKPFESPGGSPTVTAITAVAAAATATAATAATATATAATAAAEAAAAATTAAAAAAEAAAATALRTFLSLVDTQRTTVEVGAVHGLNRGLSLFFRSHGDETETT